MDIFFKDPDEVPLPPEEVRIREFSAVPWQDGSKARVYLEVDPFQRPPCAEVFILDQNARVLAQVDIIETVTRKMEFNMHLRLSDPAGQYKIHVILYYQQQPTAEEAGERAGEPAPGRRIVDEAEKTFVIPVNN